MGIYRWELDLPRIERWVSHSTSRLMTADCSARPPPAIESGFGSVTRIVDLSGSQYGWYELLWLAWRTVRVRTIGAL